MHSNAIYGNGGQKKRIGWEEWSRGVFKQLKKCWRVLLCTQACGHRAFSWPRVRPDWMRWLVGFIRKTTVRLLTHVLCKPIHFFFHSFIATMPYSLQTSFSSVMKDWEINTMYGVPFKVKLVVLQTRVFSHSKGTHIHTYIQHMCSYIISVVYKCLIISYLKGFTLFYHIPHTYGMHISLESYYK